MTIRKKLTLTIVTAIAMAINDYYGHPVSVETVNVIAIIVTGALVGQGLADLGDYLGANIAKTGKS